jgi:ketol-acid reductoisomerase
MLTPIKPLDAALQAFRDRTVAVLGYGAQGHAHALNLRDSGCRVLVAQRTGSPRYSQACADGFEPLTVDVAAERADVLLFGLPDEVAPAVYRAELAPRLRPGQTLGFMHGFCIHYGQIVPPAAVDVVLIGPKAQGRGVRSAFLAGAGAPALLAVHQDATGRGRETALGWAMALGSHRAAIFETTFALETETDLFGEQAVLCGGLTALIKAAFETLVEAGYPPELAYFECCHEVKLVADLIQERGLNGMRAQISGTARFGDLTRGPRVIGPAARAALRAILDEIRSGAFAREWIAEAGQGGPNLRRLLETEQRHPLEVVGRRIRGEAFAAKAE